MLVLEKISSLLKINPETILASASKIGVHLTIVVALWFLTHFGISQLKKKWKERSAGAPMRYLEDKKRADTLAGLARTAANGFLFLYLMMGVLSELGIDIKALAASAGIFGVAIGFGSQSLVKDVISGFFILLENQIRVGDEAIINGTGGIVEAIRFRTIVLRDGEGTVHVFPNGSIVTVANKSLDWSAYIFSIGIAYKEDIDKAIGFIVDVGESLKKDADFGPHMIDHLEVFGVDSLADSAVIIKGRIKTVPLKQWSLGREFLKRIKNKFDKEGIEIPFPYRNVLISETTQESASKTI